MGLLQRYILRQLTGPFAFALMALTSILLLNQVARRFGHLVGKGLDWLVIAEVFALSIPFIVAMTMPMAVLLAVLYTFSQLSADSEITAMRASGISATQLLTPVIVAGALLSAGTFVFVDQVLPRSNARLRTLLFDIARKKPTLELEEQIVNEIPPSRLFLRSSRIDPNSGRLKDVVIYDLTSQDRPRIIYADSGQMGVAGNLMDLTIKLHQGEIHEFETEDARAFRLTAFKLNTILIRNVSNQLERGTTAAVRGDRELSTCEMQDIVRQARRDIAQARRDRNRFLRSDLRALMELPPLAGLPQNAATSRRIICEAWQGAINLILPKTAEATELAQDTLVPLKLLRHPKKEAYHKPEIEPIVANRNVALVPWSSISAARDVERVAQRKANSYLVEIHKKWAISMACLAFVVVGIPMALRFPRGGMGLVIGGGLTVFTIYYVGLTAGEGLGDLGRMDPWIPMWAPNILLTTFGILGMLAVARHTGTARGGDFADLWQSIKAAMPQRGAAE
ncbi:MAG: LptF/LptG family permease [Gemmatimonadales bacterium]